MTRLKRLAAQWVLPALAGAALMQTGTVAAADNADALGLKLANAISPDRFFIRAGAIGVKVKTESGDAYDVTGPIMTQADIGSLRGNQVSATRYDALPIKQYLTAIGITDPGATDLASLLANSPNFGLTRLLGDMQANKIDALGVPSGVKSVSKESMGTAGISLGYYLDDEYKWTVEAYVLAQPISASVYGGNRPPTYLKDFPLADGETVSYWQPFGLQGRKIIDTKLFPPTVVLGRYWGDKDAKLRPYTGVIAMYALFYDTKATQELNVYNGGSNPGDTTVSFKNTFGFGPMLGLRYKVSDSWHVSLNVGSVKLKTQGTIVTRNTVITSDTPSVQDYGRQLDQVNSDAAAIYELIATANQQILLTAGTAAARAAFNLADGDPNNNKGDATKIITGALAYKRSNGAVTDGNLGTYVRKAGAILNNTIFMLSVGRTF